MSAARRRETPRKAALRAGLGLAMLLAAKGMAGCEAPPSTTALCAVEGQVYSDRCPTRCESRCALADRAECEPEDCLASCKAFEATLGEECLDASYVYWRCLRGVGLPEVQCENGEPQYLVSPDACASQRDVQTVACGTGPTDAGEADAMPREGATGAPDSSSDSDAAHEDAATD